MMFPKSQYKTIAKPISDKHNIHFVPHQRYILHMDIIKGWTCKGKYLQH